MGERKGGALLRGAGAPSVAKPPCDRRATPPASLSELPCDQLSTLPPVVHPRTCSCATSGTGGGRGGGVRNAPRNRCPHTSHSMPCFSSIHRCTQPWCAHCAAGWTVFSGLRWQRGRVAAGGAGRSESRHLCRGPATPVSGKRVTPRLLTAMLPAQPQGVSKPAGSSSDRQMRQAAGGCAAPTTGWSAVPVQVPPWPLPRSAAAPMLPSSSAASAAGTAAASNGSCSLSASGDLMVRAPQRRARSDANHRVRERHTASREPPDSAARV